MCSTILLHTQTMQLHDPQFPAPLVSNGNGSGNGNDSSSVSANPHNASRGMQGLRVLVCLASYDFGQFPLLEEVLDSYQDFCVAGASIDVYIHTAIPYTVGLIDMLNARLSCEGMQIIIAVQSPAVRLNLVDRHRQLFYEKIDDYDLFIYSEVSSKFCAFHSLFMHSLVLLPLASHLTFNLLNIKIHSFHLMLRVLQDDIKVSPTTAHAYLQETKQVEQLIGKSPAEDYNVGIVRYEYNYPPDIVIDDKTRHATEGVTRVFWEHLWKPLFPKSIDIVHQEEVKNRYVSMQNHHQGMFMATRDLLKAWKNRKGCDFDVVRQRPGKKNQPSQPIEGTQRVWMSSQMLHGGKHCNVQQLIPMKNFGQLSVWHLPNKNYRRVGKKGRIGGGEVQNDFGTGKENFVGPDASLPTEMDLHLQMRKLYPMAGEEKYSGIQMIDEVDHQRRFNRVAGGFAPYMELLDQRMNAFRAYAERGGVLSEEDFSNWDWVTPKEDE